MHEDFSPHPEAASRLQQRLSGDFAALLDRRRRQTSPKRFRQTANLVSIIGAPEVKLAVSLTSRKLGRVSSFAIYRALRACRGNDSQGWVPSDPGGYFYKGFIPAGIATVEQIESASTARNTVAGFALDPAQEERIIPAIGLLADWSLRYPDISLLQLAGTSHNLGKCRSAEVRLNLLLEMLTTPADKDLAIGEFIGLSDVPRSSVIDMLSEAGQRDDWITVHNVSINNESLYRRAGPPKLLPTDDIVKQYCYHFLRGKKRGDEFTQQQLLDYITVQLLAQDPDANLIDAKNRLSALIQTGNKQLGIERLSLYNRGYRTKLVALDDPAIVELANIVLALHEPDLHAEKINFGRQRAQEIANEPRDLAALLDKSDRFSRNSRPNVQETRAALLDIVRNRYAAMTAGEIMQAYAELTGARPPSHESITAHMKAMVEEGKITITKTTVSDTWGRPALRYAAKSGLMSRNESAALGKRIEDGLAARREVVARMSPLIIELARDAASAGDRRAFTDLVDTARQALAAGLEAYEHRSGHHLAAFATACIRRALHNATQEPTSETTTSEHLQHIQLVLTDLDANPSPFEQFHTTQNADVLRTLQRIIRHLHDQGEFTAGESRAIVARYIDGLSYKQIRENSETHPRQSWVEKHEKLALQKIRYAILHGNTGLS